MIVGEYGYDGLRICMYKCERDTERRFSSDRQTDIRQTLDRQTDRQTDRQSESESESA